MKNIVLIGMMGAGKSTVGQLLAGRLKKTLVDTDKLIEAREGLTVEEIFATQGEDYFRSLEVGVAQGLSLRSGLIIACGGGIIKSPANVRALRQNGPVLWVRRPIEKLATCGRPLSKGGAALKQLEEERTPLYEAAASVVLDNTGTLREAADKAAALFEADETL